MICHRLPWLSVALLVASAAVTLDGCARTSPPPAKSPAAPPPPPPAPSIEPRPRPPAEVARGGNVRPTGIGTLVGNRLEPPGFGLYSYLLFGSLPSDATRPLYVAILKASLSKIEPIQGELQTFPPAQLNLYLMPLLSELPQNTQLDDLANWIVDKDHYNYPRAQQILAALPGRRSGVYIISVLSRPIDPSRQLQPPYLLQDLSDVDPRIADAWIQYFLNQAAKDKPWQESVADQLALDLRNNIERVADQMQLAIPAMATAIKWFKPGA